MHRPQHWQHFLIEAILHSRRIHCKQAPHSQPRALWLHSTVWPGDHICFVLQALQQQMSELETKLVQARTDSKAQVKGHNSGKKELEARVPPLLSCCFCVAWALQL